MTSLNDALRVEARKVADQITLRVEARKVAEQIRYKCPIRHGVFDMERAVELIAAFAQSYADAMVGAAEKSAHRSSRKAGRI